MLRGIIVVFIPFLFIPVDGSDVLPLRFRVEELSNPLRVDFICLFDDASSDVKEITFWYKPHYPTATRLILYQWRSETEKGNTTDPLVQARVTVSVDWDKKVALLSIIYPVFHDSGAYHCEMTFTSEKRSSLAVHYWRSNIDVESVRCDSVEPIYGKTGLMSCFYFPIYSSPSIIKWSRLVAGSKKEIYEYSFLHARGQKSGELPLLQDRVSHELDISTGKTSLTIANTSLPDTGLYTIQVLSRFASVAEDIHYSVEDLGALQLMVSSTAKCCLTLSGDYHYQAFSVSRIEWYLIECEKVSLILTHDVLDDKTWANRRGVSHIFNNKTGRFHLMWKDSKILPLVLRLNMNTTVGPLQTEISVQYIEGMEQSVKPIINIWPEPVAGDDAKTVCRRMCSVLPDVSSLYIKKHIATWMMTSNLDEVWISTDNSTIVSIGKMRHRKKCFVIHQNDLIPKEKNCTEKTQLICINLKHSESPQWKKQGGSSPIQDKIWSSIIFPLGSLIIFSILLSWIIRRRLLSNKKEYFRRPWDNVVVDRKDTDKLLNRDPEDDIGIQSSKRDLYYSSWGFKFEDINSYTIKMIKQQHQHKPVVVGILSSGFDMKHPIFTSLLPKPWHNIAIKGTSTDLFGQGTFLAGVIIEQCIGVIDHVQLVNLQAVSSDGMITTNTVKSCLKYCVEGSNRPDILLIPNCFTEVLSSELRPLLEELMIKTVVVISASNDRRSPKDMKHVGILANLIIGSHDKGGKRCHDSPDYWGIDFLAPGSCVTSAKAGTKEFINGSGTVAAAAWVCGILVHVMLQARCIAEKHAIPVEYTTWVMHNVLLAMTEEKVRFPGNGHGSLKPEKILLCEEEFKSILKAASIGSYNRR